MTFQKSISFIKIKLFGIFHKTHFRYFFRNKHLFQPVFLWIMWKTLCKSPFFHVFIFSFLWKTESYPQFHSSDNPIMSTIFFIFLWNMYKFNKLTLFFTVWKLTKTLRIRNFITPYRARWRLPRRQHRDEIRFANLALMSGRQMSFRASTMTLASSPTQKKPPLWCDPKKLDFYCVTDLTSVTHFLCS